MERLISKISSKTELPTLLKIEFSEPLRLDQEDNISILQKFGTTLQPIFEKSGEPFELRIRDTYVRCGHTIRNYFTRRLGLIYVSGFSLTFGLDKITQSDAESVLDIVEQVFPNSIRSVIGDAVSKEENKAVKKYSGPKDEFIRVPDKTIVTEDDQSIFVPSFVVATRQVSVKKFLEFTNETGYKTTAHLSGDYKTFDDNECVEGNDPETCSAPLISKIDALAYCEWKKCRLLTEAEYLSARISDWNVYPPNSCLTLIDIFRRNENALIGGREWTSSYAADSGKAIIRNGPIDYLKYDWKEMKFCHVIEADETFYDIVTSFREVKID